MNIEQIIERAREITLQSDRDIAVEVYLENGNAMMDSGTLTQVVGTFQKDGIYSICVIHNGIMMAYRRTPENSGNRQPGCVTVEETIVDTLEGDELKRLRRDNAQLRDERDELVKALEEQRKAYRKLYAQVYGETGQEGAESLAQRNSSDEDSNLVKILMHNEVSESVWATHLYENLYRIENVPFFNKKFHFRDVVIANSHDEGMPIAIETSQESGWRTLSIVSIENYSKEEWLAHPVHKYLAEIGWSGEGAFFEVWFLVLPVKPFESASQITDMKTRFPDLSITVY